MGFFSLFFSKPETHTFTVTSDNGFHLRPVAKFVTVAKDYKSDIAITFNGHTVNAKGVNSLLSLSLEKGDSFLLSCKGKDAKEAKEALTETFATLMKDDTEMQVLDKESASYKGKYIDAEIIASGIAIAPAFFYKEHYVRRKDTHPFHASVALSMQELERLYEEKKGEPNAEIFLAQKELLSSLKYDLVTLEDFEERLHEISTKLMGTKMEAKIIDYKDILHRIKTNMGFRLDLDFPKISFILCADDLLPSQIEVLQQTKVVGVILKETSINSHTAILLRGSGIPSLIADTSSIDTENTVILDGHAGVIVTDPVKKDLEQASIRREEDEKQHLKAQKQRFETSKTKTGKQIHVFANVTDVNSAKTAKEEGAEGIGLFRTEFLFKKKKPSFEQQVTAYEKIIDLFENITVRTLDVGGDKALPYIKLDREDNPFLGIRGVRLFKTHPDIIEEQLHAMFIAAKNRPIKIMFPMVSSVEEFVEAKIFAEEISKKHQQDISNIKFGIMIEVPSVLFLLEEFNKVVDFYSIGTNDLTQYLFAIERTHTTLKTNDLSPAVFNAIQMIVQKADKPVSICGELAGNTKAIPLLIKLGIETLSVSGKNVAQTKEIIRYV